ncbi:MAG: substrate-binding domain-containing protein, partial [Candidatus Atribacteria bacterium]|nr:substrate-binding domain-containing protein [Candidatus Atribacteria bacterium]
TADIVNFSTSCLFELIKRNIPIVLLGGGFDEVSLSRVDIDLEQASYELTHYLLGRGYHRFLYLSGLKEASTFKRRIVGFQKAMAEAGYSVVDDQIIETHPDIDGGYEETRRIFSEKRNASEVVLCVNDFMAFGVLKAMKELQLRVPEDVGVVGFDDISFASMAGVPITTVHIPVDELAQKGINMLCRQIEGQASGMSNAVQVEFVPTHLIVRNSTA